MSPDPYTLKPPSLCLVQAPELTFRPLNTLRADGPPAANHLPLHLRHGRGRAWTSNPEFNIHEAGR